MLRKVSMSLIFLSVLFGSRAIGQAVGIGSIADLSWMSGCWEIDDRAKNYLVSEQWMKPAGRTMLGMARTVKNGSTSGYEFIRIVQDDKGIFYVAKPSQNISETYFKMVSKGKSMAAFENPDHDFPQRISYRREGNNLHAAIEGVINGKKSAINYPMTRTRCD